jgi:hypothetical protein
MPACQSALQPWVSLGLLYNQSPPGVRFLNKIIFYRTGLLAPCPTPNLEDRENRMERTYTVWAECRIVQCSGRWYLPLCLKGRSVYCVRQWRMQIFWKGKTVKLYNRYLHQRSCMNLSTNPSWTDWRRNRSHYEKDFTRLSTRARLT